MIFVVKVTTGKEDQAADLIAEKVKKTNSEVYSIVRPHGLRGYIFLEAETTKAATDAIANLPYVKSLLKKHVSYEEIEATVRPSIEAISIEKGDIVEILTPPFKREKAKVIRVDKTKGEIVIELLEAAVSIPITVKIDNVKVIRRTSEPEESE